MSLPRLIDAAATARKASWWVFVANCCSNRRTPSRPSLGQMSEVGPGMVLEATDRRYIVTASGAWKRVDRENVLPASKSQIRMLPKPSRSKYSPEREQEHTPSAS